MDLAPASDISVVQRMNVRIEIFGEMKDTKEVMKVWPKFAYSSQSPGYVGVAVSEKGKRWYLEDSNKATKHPFKHCLRL